MQELTYEQYREAGGTSDHSTFLLLRIDAEAELERQTFGRIEKLDDKIIRCMTLIIDQVLTKTEDDNIQSFSNSIDSITYGDANTPEGKQKRIRALCLKYLPKELTYRGTKC